MSTHPSPVAPDPEGFLEVDEDGVTLEWSEDRWPVPSANGQGGRDDEQTGDLFRTYTTAELLAMGGQITWRARGFMVHPTHGMVAGEQKTLKSYIGIFMDVAVAAGVQVFGRFEVVERCPVLSYVGEGGRIPHKGRLERVAAALGVDLASIPLFTSYDVAPIASERFQQSLRRDLGEHTPGVVSLDPLYAYHGTTTDARNLHDEGALLASLSGQCADADASLKIVNHFNQTGTGRGLHRITMAGAAEWCDSWWLVSHREAPDIPAGHFRLLLETGSRQWGGSEWDLDLNLGHLNNDTLDYDEPITWQITPHHPATAEHDTDEAIIQTLVDEPWTHTRTGLAARIGGNATTARAAIGRLEHHQRIRCRPVARREGGRTVTRDLYAMTSEPSPEEQNTP